MGGRYKKYTVDYFSHDADASHKKTISILFNHYGHDGISAWWQRLEELASHDHHYIDIRETEDFEFLASAMRFKPDDLRKILNKMAELSAIDSELFQKGIIWCQKFVDRLLLTVYTERTDKPVSKPSFIDGKITFIGGEIQNIGGKMHQSKAEQSEKRK